MSNIALALKEEIIRLSRKETRSEIDKLRKISTQYRSEIAALKRRTLALEQQISRMGKQTSKQAVVNEEKIETTKNRFTAKGFKSLRKRLGLTAAEIGILLEVATPTIYNWESGNSSPREPQMEKIVMLRGMGKKQVNALINYKV
jgi:DNA-binding transcriptional regulator YiaG